MGGCGKGGGEAHTRARPPPPAPPSAAQSPPPTPPETDADTDAMLAACERAGVVFMDGTMWVHHPRAAALAAALPRVGRLEAVTATLAFAGGSAFEDADVRTFPDLDGLGAWGDLGWYCVRAGLWAAGGGDGAGAPLPTTVAAHPGTQLNARGVCMAGGATAVWPGGVPVLTFNVSFRRCPAQRLEIAGTAGAAALDDFVIPARPAAACFSLAACAGGAAAGGLPCVTPDTQTVEARAGGVVWGVGVVPASARRGGDRWIDG